MRYKSIVFCTADPTKNAGSIRDYFIEQSEEFVTFHFFPSYSNEKSYVEKFIKGKKVTRKEFPQFTKNVLIKNIFDFAFFSYVLLFFTRRGSFLLVNTPFYCLFNFLFTLVKSIRYVFWIGDYYPQKQFPMNLYHKLVEHLNYNLQYVLYLSPPIEKIYGKKRKKHAFRKVIQLGIKKEFEKKSSPKKKIKIGFIGIIREQQGLELALFFLKHSDNCTLDVVGDGYKLSYYKNLAREMNILHKITFFGKVENIAPIFKTWDVGIALYEESDKNLSTYCEPTKLKHYLSFGLPVITTRTTYFSNEVNLSHAGIVIDEQVEELGKAVQKIASDYQKYVAGVKDLTSKYEYKAWYDKKFQFLRGVV